MQSNDFAGWQETHSTNGATRALMLPAEVHQFWSHDSARQGGVGLWVKKTFLSNFNPPADEDWEEIEAGRVAVLHLRDPQGGLDIFVIYHHTGNSAQAKNREAPLGPPLLLKLAHDQKSSPS